MKCERNGAHVKGLVYEKHGKKYLKAIEIMQKRESRFHPVKKPESWMPFDGCSNGGQWVHKI